MNHEFPAIKDCDYQTPMLRMREMMLEAEIAMYAESPAPRDSEMETNLRDQVYCFLVDSHNARYPKGRYTRHVMFLIAQAIVARTGVPWEEVHSKAWMRGTKSNIPAEVAVASEIFIPDPCISSRRRGILEIRQPPSLPSAPLHSGEPAPIAGPCQRCMETETPCQRMEGWVACIPCHERKKKCLLTPIGPDTSDTSTGHVAVGELQRTQPEILDEIRQLEAAQEAISRSIEDILAGQKDLYEVISSWLSTEEHRLEKSRQT